MPNHSRGRSSAQTAHPRTRRRRGRSIRSRRPSAPCRSSSRSAMAISPQLGVAEGDKPAQRRGDFGLVALRRQCGGHDIGRRGRTADAGKAVDEERRPAVPTPREIEQLADMILAGRGHVGLLDDDVVHRQDEMVRAAQIGRPVDRRAGVEQASPCGGRRSAQRFPRSSKADRHGSCRHFEPWQPIRQGPDRAWRLRSRGGAVAGGSKSG